tara:strand:+ start:374 stop:1159 length:786 start_codon:yes stop_codon:yes gene_type:complete
MISNIKKNQITSLLLELGDEVEKIKQHDIDLKIKFKKDQSPLSKADLFLNEQICNFLRKIHSSNIISEESSEVSFAKRKKWDYFWIIDPIDGTKEFLNKGTDYTINIALCKGNSPILSYVYAPARNEMFHAEKGISAFLNQKKITVSKISSKVLNIVASKSHLNDETMDFINRIKELYPIKLSNYGSSLKICRVAEGKADIYPRFGPTMEWDTCAADLILSEAGGELVEKRGKRLTYNKENLLNPNFVAKSKSFEIKQFLK